jgi:hypothetical protein
VGRKIGVLVEGGTKCRTIESVISSNRKDTVFLFYELLLGYVISFNLVFWRQVVLSVDTKVCENRAVSGCTVEVTRRCLENKSIFIDNRISSTVTFEGFVSLSAFFVFYRNVN